MKYYLSSDCPHLEIIIYENLSLECAEFCLGK
jgi:hypothetical protein